jgi:bacterioferritin (cytochrome b1)
MIKENLIAGELFATTIVSWIRFFADKDITTRVMMEGILAKEEERQ